MTTKWILSSEAAPYTEGDWLGENGELIVGHASETLLKSGIRVLALRAVRGEYCIDLNIDERQARKLVDKILAAFGMYTLDEDEKLIEEFEETVVRQAHDIADKSEMLKSVFQQYFDLQYEKDKLQHETENLRNVVGSFGLGFTQKRIEEFEETEVRADGP